MTCTRTVPWITRGWVKSTLNMNIDNDIQPRGWVKSQLWILICISICPRPRGFAPGPPRLRRDRLILQPPRHFATPPQTLNRFKVEVPIRHVITNLKPYPRGYCASRILLIVPAHFATPPREGPPGHNYPRDTFLQAGWFFFSDV